MGKLFAGFTIGAILVVALFLGPLRPLITRGEEGTPPTVPTVTPASEDGRDIYTTGDIKQIFNEVRAQITTQDTLDYYDKLVSSYDLKDTTLTGDQLTDKESVLSALPNIGNIAHSAATLPLIEVGKQIKDPEIAEFYYKYLNDAGLDIKPR